MKPYDPEKLLIFTHIPKTAGTSAHKPFQAWFGLNFYRHYFLMSEGTLPMRDCGPCLYESSLPAMLCGHFKKQNGLRIKNYLPKQDQFITILRDPFEQAVSKYFYVTKEGANTIDQCGMPDSSIETYLLTLQSDILDYFPEELTLANYKEQIERYFIAIGITECYTESIKRFARMLGMPYSDELIVKHNSTERDRAIPAYLREQFMERHELEYAVYDYALQQHHAAEAANTHRTTP